MKGRAWLEEVKNNNTMAFCNLCQKNFVLGNMGETAVKSHGKGKNHLQKMDLQSTNSIKEFVKPTENSCDPNQNKTPNSTSGNKFNFFYNLEREFPLPLLRKFFRCLNNYLTPLIPSV